MTTPNDRSVERAAFEKWASAQGWAREDIERRSVITGHYAVTLLQHACDAWQARATLERAEVGSVVPEQVETISRALNLFHEYVKEYGGGSRNHHRDIFGRAVRALTALTETQRSCNTAGSDDPKAGSGSTQAGREPLTDEQERQAFYAAWDECARLTGHKPTSLDVWLLARGRMTTDGRALAPSSTPRDRSA